MKNLILISLMSIVMSLTAQDQIIEDFSASQCDSMINDNVDNPNFVILDVRTPNEHIPQHLEGAINRDFYDSDFEEQLDLLDKEKAYVMHCRSGGRSGSTLNMMKDLGFKEVYNMLGGTNAWNRGGFNTTKEFAPRIMLVTEMVQDIESVQLGSSKKAKITITNRANDQLILSSIINPNIQEFSTDFIEGTILEGSDDYSFDVTYSPMDIGEDEATFVVESNAGNIDFIMEGVGIMSTSISRYKDVNIHVYPNPVISNMLIVDGLNDDETLLRIISTTGQVVFSQKLYKSGVKLDISNVLNGIYSFNLSNDEGVITTKRIIVE